MARLDPKMALMQALIPGPGYGLDLMKKLEEKTKGSIRLSQAAAYAALRALEDEGLAESYLGDEKIPETGGRPRRYFKLTAEGKRVALEDREAVSGLFGLVPAKVRAMIATLITPGVAR